MTDAEYVDRLIRLQTAPWKERLNVQALHRWNLLRLHPGFTLEIGCGIGRNLINLRDQSVGIDVNEHCVRAAVARGLTAFTPGEFARSAEYNRPARFDALLVAHVAEHMTEPEAVALVGEYDRLIRRGGALILIAPQEAGFKSDPTHVQFMDFDRLRSIARAAGYRPDRAYSFPLPRWTGRWFKYNEFVVVGRKAG